MSEAAVGGTSAGTATDVGSSSGTADSNFQGQVDPNGAQRRANANDGGQITDRNQQGSSTETDDDSEEVNIGSVKGRVPKTLAKAIKDFERGSHQKMREAAEARKFAHERQQLLALLEQDPDAFAQHYSQMTGRKFDLDSFAEERLARKYELMNMNPEQRKLLEAQNRIKQLEDADLHSKKGLISAIKEIVGEGAPKNLEKYSHEELGRYLEHQRGMMSKAKTDLETEFLTAWKESGLPNDPFFGALFSIQMMMDHNQNSKNPDYRPLQAAEAVARIKPRFLNCAKAYISSLDPRGIQEFLGKELLAKVRQYDIDRVTAKAASTVGQSNRPGTPPASEVPRKPMNEYEWREHIRRMKV